MSCIIEETRCTPVGEMYSCWRDVYTPVGEIKSDASEDAEVQNVEQMVGLFRQRQQAMLGFTLHMFYPPIDCSW